MIIMIFIPKRYQKTILTENITFITKLNVKNAKKLSNMHFNLNFTSKMLKIYKIM